MKSGGVELCQGRFKVAISKGLYIQGVAGRRSRLLRETVTAPSLTVQGVSGQC